MPISRLYDNISEARQRLNDFSDDILDLAPVQVSLRSNEIMQPPRMWYHGTCSSALPAILEEGIRPRPLGGVGNYPDRPSIECLIYLTLGFGPHYAIGATNGDDSPVILEIDSSSLDWSHVYPDEDYLQQVEGFAKFSKLVLSEFLLGGHSDLTEYLRGDHEGLEFQAAFRQHVSLSKSEAAQVARVGEPMNSQQLWQRSMEGLGAISYAGYIPREAITRYVVQKKYRSSLPWYIVMGGEINMNYYLFRARALHLLTAHLFDGTILFPEWKDAVYLNSLPRETLAEVQHIKKTMRTHHRDYTRVHRVR